MRIVIIAEVYLPKVDGVVIRTMNLIRHLVEAGDEILVICPQVDDRGESPVRYVEFRSFPFPAYPEYLVGVPDQRLPAAVRDFGPDLIHFINPFAFGFRSFDLLHKAGVNLPTVFSFHTLYGEFVKRYPLLKPLSRTLWWLMRDYHNCADANLTVSTVMRDELTVRGFQRVQFWPPAVDSRLFHPGRADAQMRQRLSKGDSERPLLITVSRLAPEKNVAFLADVLKQTALQQSPQPQLAVIGDGPQRAELERRFAGLPAHFFGYLKGEELAAAYASADAFVYASETETMGNVVLEAMASGLPVIVPRAGGIPSLLVHGEDGLMFAPGDKADAVASLQAVLGDEALRRRLGAAARARIEDSGWRESIACVRQHYVETIAEHQRGGGAAVPRLRLAPAVMASLVTAFQALAKRRKLAARTRSLATAKGS
ncbi:MAG TPA: glycosyltransferase family 1 protein [Pirellulales bacterium]|jgi:glycosyltransferase involved in cell wall biosynthesis|nr:glycosyltransferase family 1 protein [Pirellulales bacterium]